MITRIEACLPAQFRIAREKLSKSPIAYRLASGAFWSLLGGLTSRIFSLASSIFVARIIGKEAFGEFGMVQSTMGMFGVLAGFGLGSTATKYVAEYRRLNLTKAGNISNLTLLVSLASSAVLAVVCVSMSSWLASETLHRPDISDLLMAGSLLLFFSTMNSVLLGILTGFEAFRCAARINIWQGIAAPLVAIPLVWYFGVSGAVASLTVNAALGVLLCSLALRTIYLDVNISAIYSQAIWSEWPLLWKFTLPSILSGLMVAPVTWLTNLILVNQNDGYGELGLFNAANQWRIIIMFLPGLLASVLLPVLSDAHGRDSKIEFTQAVKLNLKATWVVCLPLTIIVIVLNRPLAILFGKSFIGTEPVMALLMVSCFLIVVNNTVGTALAGSGRMWTGMVMNTGWAAVLVASSYLLVPTMGAKGLAAAYLVAYFLHTIWTMLYVEVKLAPSSISSQWQLILFSLLLLAIAMRSVLSATDTYLSALILIVLALIPVLRFMQNSLSSKPESKITGDIS